MCESRGLLETVEVGGDSSWGGVLSPVVASLGPVARGRLRAASRRARDCTGLEPLQRAWRAALLEPWPRGFSAAWPSVAQELLCPASFTRSLLLTGDLFTPEPLCLQGFPQAKLGDPGRYEVAEGVEALASLIACCRAAKGPCGAPRPDAVDAADSEAGRSALHFAAVGGSEPVAELLLEMRANVNLQDVLDYTPLDLAVCHAKPGLARLLERAGGVTGAELPASRQAPRAVGSVACATTEAAAAPAEPGESREGDTGLGGGAPSSCREAPLLGGGAKTAVTSAGLPTMPRQPPSAGGHGLCTKIAALRASVVLADDLPPGDLRVPTPARAALAGWSARRSVPSCRRAAVARSSCTPAADACHGGSQPAARCIRLSPLRRWHANWIRVASGSATAANWCEETFKAAGRLPGRGLAVQQAEGRPHASPPDLRPRPCSPAAPPFTADPRCPPRRRAGAQSRVRCL